MKKRKVNDKTLNLIKKLKEYAKLSSKEQKKFVKEFDYRKIKKILDMSYENNDTIN